MLAMISRHDAGADFEVDLTPGFFPPVRCIRPDEDVADQPLIPRRSAQDGTEQPVEKLAIVKVSVHLELKRCSVIGVAVNAIAQGDAQIVVRRQPQYGTNVCDDGHAAHLTSTLTGPAGTQ